MSRDGIWLTLTYAVRVQILFRPLVSSGSPTRQRGRNSKPMSTETSGTTDAEDSTDKQAAIETELEDILDAIEGEDPVAVFEDPYLTRAAMMKNGGESDYQRVLTAVKDSNMNSNEYRSVVSERAEEIRSDPLEGEEPERKEVQQPEREVTINEVRREVLENFDRRTWDLTEAIASTVATLLLDSAEGCAGMVAEGPSSAGKTTVVDFFDGIEGMIYRSDQLTPASFVSHSTDQSNTGENDLLPRVRHKALTVKDMGPLFNGNRERVDEFMSVLATVMDGRGYTRDTGAQGSHGYEGDYRFALVGATTPLPPRAWATMGHVGPRLLFHDMPDDDNPTEAMDDVWSEQGEYADRKSECCETIGNFMRGLWTDHGGYGSVEWDTQPDDEVKRRLTAFANLIAKARAPVYNDEDQLPESSEPENIRRVLDSLKQLARGHALLHGRRKVEWADMDLCARVALSTIPRKRREHVAMLVDPQQDVRGIDTGDVMKYCEVSKPTALNRMRLMDALGLADFSPSERNRPARLDVKENYRNLFTDDVEYPDMFTDEEEP